MELSSRVEYALLALLEMSNSQHRGKPLKANEIANIQGIPERYLDQILLILRRSGIIQSQRGVKGGYLLKKKPKEISLRDIVALLDGDVQKNSEKEANMTAEKKVVIDIWTEISQAYQTTLASYTLEDFQQKRNTYQKDHPMYYI